MAQIEQFSSNLFPQLGYNSNGLRYLYQNSPWLKNDATIRSTFFIKHYTNTFSNAQR